MDWTVRRIGGTARERLGNLQADSFMSQSVACEVAAILGLAFSHHPSTSKELARTLDA